MKAATYKNFFQLLIIPICWIALLSPAYAYSGMLRPSNAPNSLPQGKVGATNVLPALPSAVNVQMAAPPPKVENTELLILEIHFVGTKTSAADYQKNGVNCKGGTLSGDVDANGGFLTYFCIMKIFPWYYTSENPIYASFQQETKNLVPWTNPISQTLEYVTTSPDFKDGLPITTFISSNCDGSLLSYKKDDKSFYINDIVWNGASLHLNLPSEKETLANLSTPSQQNTSRCNMIIRKSAMVVPGQVIKVIKSYSGGANVFLKNNEGRYAWTAPSADMPQSHTCTADYTVQAEDMGRTISLSCCTNQISLLNYISTAAPQDSTLPIQEVFGCPQEKPNY